MSNHVFPLKQFVLNILVYVFVDIYLNSIKAARCLVGLIMPQGCTVFTAGTVFCNS